jgi:plasmid stability protein
MKEASKRATVYFDADVHQALRLKAAVMSRSVSEVVNDAVRRALSEDVEDLAAFDKRANDPRHDFDSLVSSLRKRGKT